METSCRVGRGVTALIMAMMATATGCTAQSHSTRTTAVLVPRRSVQPAAMAVMPRLELPPAASCETLDDLVAPIALYPDALLAQVLTASTLPLEVVQAARWVKAHPGLECLDDQGWDPSVLAVARYGTVIAMMDDRIDWTAKLGEAFLDRQEDVMAAIQRQRARARSVGSLCDTPEQVIIVRDEAICIEPVTEVIYVPVYTPSYVYVRPSYDCVPSSFVRFSVGFSSGSWLDLGCNWRERRVCVDRDRWRGDRHHDRDRRSGDHRDAWNGGGRDHPRELAQGGAQRQDAAPTRAEAPTGAAWTPSPKVQRSRTRVERATVNNSPRWKSVEQDMRVGNAPVDNAPRVRTRGEHQAEAPRTETPDFRETRATPPPRMVPTPPQSSPQTQTQPTRRAEVQQPRETPKAEPRADQPPPPKRETVVRPMPPSARAAERQRAADAPSRPQAAPREQQQPKPAAQPTPPKRDKDANTVTQTGPNTKRRGR